MRTLLIGGLLASAMLVPALAQTSPPPASPAPAAQSTAPKADGEMWRSSKLIGLNVYNDQDEKLGAISEILLDKSGKVDFVVIGVGGFLGIGQHDIKIELSKLKFVDEPVRTSDHHKRTRFRDDRYGEPSSGDHNETSSHDHNDVHDEKQVVS